MRPDDGGRDVVVCLPEILHVAKRLSRGDFRVGISHRLERPGSQSSWMWLRAQFLA